jgi:large-conductance mechanosensitive channel
MFHDKNSIMKFIAAILTFLLSIAALIFLMIKMAGTGMPMNPLDQEKDRIEYVMEMEEQARQQENMVKLEDYVDYFDLKSEEENEG